MKKNMGVPASPSGLRPSDGAVPSPAEPLVPNAAVQVLRLSFDHEAKSDLLAMRHDFRGASQEMREANRLRASVFGRLGPSALRERAERAIAASPTDSGNSCPMCCGPVDDDGMTLAASGMEAASAGETTKIDSTEGESAVGEAETPKGQSHDQ